MYIFRHSRDFHVTRRERRIASAPGWRRSAIHVSFSARRPTNLEPTFRDNLARPFSTPAYENEACTENQHFASFISIRQSGIVRASDTKCSASDVLSCCRIRWRRAWYTQIVAKHLWDLLWALLDSCILLRRALRWNYWTWECQNIFFLPFHSSE